MRKLIVAIIVLLLNLIMVVMATACAADADQEAVKLPANESQSTQMPATVVLPIVEPAPAWDNEDWINSEAPILLQGLRGKAVLLEFSTSL